MKFVGLGDLHINVWDKNDLNSKHIEETFIHLEKFIKEKVPDYLIIFGDLFDAKTMTSTEGLINIVNKIDYLSSFCKVKIIVGNHDIASATNTELSLPNVFKNKNNIDVVDKYHFFLDDSGIYHFLPYYKDTELIKNINSININESKSNYLFGHFGVNGFIMNNYSYNETIKNVIDDKSTITPSYLKKFKKVFLGHYHGFQNESNIIYVSSPIELRHGDEFTKHGFIYFDSNKEEIVEFKENNKFSPKHITLEFNKSNVNLLKEIKKNGGYKIRLIVPNFSQDKLIKLKYDFLKNNLDLRFIFKEEDKHEISIIDGWDNFVKQDTEFILKEFVKNNIEKTDFNEQELIQLILNK